MSLAQQLLMRALVAWFWDQPYRQPLVRWGTALHDRFMLPHFLWADFESVIADLRRRRPPACKPNGSRPTSSSAFPCWARVEHAGVALELRQALEPWLVLGEESDRGGTARTVDSSLERVQVLVDGATRRSLRRRPATAIALPLTATGTLGRSGRRRALPRLASRRTASIPTIAPHVPLTFDIDRHLDTAARSAAAATTRASRAAATSRRAGQRPGGRRPAPRSLRDALATRPGASAPTAAAASPRFPADPRPAARRVDREAPIHTGVTVRRRGLDAAVRRSATDLVSGRPRVRREVRAAHRITRRAMRNVMTKR